MNLGQDKFSCLAKEVGWREPCPYVSLLLISKSFGIEPDASTPLLRITYILTILTVT